jgi:hypothetical protein
MVFLLFPVDRLVFETMPPGGRRTGQPEGPAFASDNDLWSEFSGFKGLAALFRAEC